LENVIDRSKTYKTKALISRAGFEGLKGDIESEFYYYTGAIKSRANISDFVNASRAIAVVKSKEGFHHLAIKDMENLTPLIRHAEPCSILIS
jgi:hypothetical protein